MAACERTSRGKEVSMTGQWKSLWIFSLFFSNILNQITSAVAVYNDFEDSNEDDWRPVFHDVAPSPHSPRRYPLFSQVYTVPSAALRPAATKKAYLQVLSNANKVESYSPPSILGPLSDFGHSTVKAKRPIVLNKTNGASLPSVNQNIYEQAISTQNQHLKAPVRYENLGYSAALLPPPVLPSATPYRPDSQEADTQESVNQQYQSYRDAAFLLKTVRPPPPVEHSYRFGSASSGAQNSFFFSNNVPQQSQGLSAYHIPSKDNQKSQAANYNSPFLIGGQSPYGPPSPVYPVVVRPAVSTIHHQNLGEQYVIRPQSHVKNTEEVVLKRRPVTLYSGDVNGNKNLLSPEVLGNAKRPDNTEAPLTPTKSPGKQVFDQLAHYARPFQSNNHREKDEQGKPFASSHQFNAPNGQRPNWGNPSKQKTKGQVFGLGTIGANSQSHTYEPEKPYAAQSQAPSVYPVSVTTVDVSAGSPDPVTFVPYTDSQKDSFRPSHYYYQSTTVRPQPSDNHNYNFNKNNVFFTSSSHINVVSEEDDYPPAFLPTPTSDLRPFTFHSGNGQAVSGYTLESSFPKGKHKYAQELQENNSQVDAVTKVPESHRRRRPTAATKAPLQYTEEQFTPPATATDYPQTDQQDTEAPTVITYTEQTTTARSRRRKPTHRYKVKPSQEEIPSINFNHEISNSDFNGQNIFTQFVDYTTNPPDVNNNLGNKNHVSHNNDNGNQNYPSADGGNAGGGYEDGGNDEDDGANYPNNVRQNEVEPSTTTTTTAAPTANSRIRNRFKFGNNTRPRFSVKDYKEKLKVSSTSAPETNDPSDDMNERKEILKTRFSTRNKLASKLDTSSKNATDSDTKADSPSKKYKPRTRPNRFRTTSTQSALEALTTTTTTERPAFKPSSTPSRYKNGVSKYYSRYRTSTEAPSSNGSSDTQPAASTKSPVKLKGVFSAKRRPFPVKGGTANTEDLRTDESESDVTRGDDIPGVENEINPQATKKADNFVVSSHNLRGEESFINPEVATKPLDDVSMEYDDEEEENNAAATKVADLTSSSSNLQKQPIQNEVSATSNNRRTVPRITIATDDPILPIEAFFQSSRPNKHDRQHR
ncbi:LOW QUALITY PROTEIN: uncharacterized protein [Bemisia tabaci]|uniref:LOW QUALITY PROTEIN: uncharacterized protein n=1 Tax=Bemisia tabaci TaxID=7038 RepID=UPI003B27C874